MKQLILTVILLSSCFIKAQDLELIWFDSINTGQAVITNESFYVIDIDDQGNIYSTGNFHGDHDFDLGFGETVRSSVGIVDMYIKKEDANHNLDWVINLGEIGSISYGYSIHVDSQGDIYVLGYTSSNSLDFDYGPNIFVPTSFLEGYFIVKYSNSGEFQWVKMFNGSVYDLDFDSNNNPVVIASPVLPLGPGVFETAILIEKINPSNGSVVWSNLYQNDGFNYGTGIKVLDDNSLLATGSYQGQISFDLVNNSDMHNSSNINNVFLLKLSETGQFIWSKSFDGTANIGSNSLFLVDGNNIFLTGTFSGEVDFDLGLDVSNKNSGNQFELYLLSMDLDGNYNWVQTWEGLDAGSYISSIQLDEWGNLLISGHASDGNGIGDLHPGFAIEPSGQAAAFLELLDIEGNYIWSTFFQGYQSGYNSVQTIIKDSIVYFTGSVSQSANVSFDPDSPLNFDLGLDFGYSIFKKYILHDDSCSHFSYDLLPGKDIQCNELGQIVISPKNGLPPYQYNWHDFPLNNSPILVQDSLNFATVTITDSRECELTIVAMISGPEYPNLTDWNGNLVLGQFRPGFFSSFTVDAFNNGCQSSESILKLVLSPNISYQSSLIQPDQISGDTLIWNIDASTYDNEHFVSTIELLTSPTSQIGDTVSIEMFLQSDQNDADLSNNTRLYTAPIVNGYDPNDIRINPEGVCEEKYVDSDEKLTFTIRFQNTGNSEAVHIYILNQLDSTFDLNSLRIVGKSFDDLAVEILNNNWIKFKMDSIMLPDSLTFGNLASQGYIIYEVRSNQLAFDDVIVRNQAQIYFDFNPPIYTNTTENKWIEELPNCNSELSVYDFQNQIIKVFPNPTSHTWKIENWDSERWFLLDLQGRKLKSGNVNSLEFEIPARDLDEGTYWLSDGINNWKLVKG